MEVKVAPEGRAGEKLIQPGAGGCQGKEGWEGQEIHHLEKNLNIPIFVFRVTAYSP